MTLASTAFRHAASYVSPVETHAARPQPEQLALEPTVHSEGFRREKIEFRCSIWRVLQTLDTNRLSAIEDSEVVDESDFKAQRSRWDALSNRNRTCSELARGKEISLIREVLFAALRVST